jgi:hypothetical protein
MSRRRHSSRPRLDYEEDAPGDFDILLGGLRNELRDLADDLKRALRVEWQRVKAGTVDTLIGFGLYLFLFGFGLVLVITAAVFVALAIREALGNLGAGLAVFGGVLGAFVALRLWLRRRGVAKARKALEEERDDDYEI